MIITESIYSPGVMGQFRFPSYKLFVCWPFSRHILKRRTSKSLNFYRTMERKKNSNFLPFFKTLAQFSRLFPGLDNCWANLKIFSRILDSVRTLPLRMDLATRIKKQEQSRKIHKNSTYTSR